ncbi:hypothetical protein SK128_001377 [Halocaridina rubra]|uniref:Ionotropic glutamate receptor C-terminal domain-containing protein n=1 Tax=Halocaridina rubra TaxID=373956 RepID=A0AAN8XG54_HALRR
MSMEEVTGNKKQAEMYTGRDFIMLETLASIFNFTINILPVVSWDEVMDFSIAYEPETLTFTMRKPGLKPRWQSLYYPLTDYVWLLTLASLIIMPFILFAVDRLSCNRDSEPWSTPWVVVSEIFSPFLSQPSTNRQPNRDSLRIIIATWLIVSYVIGSLYRGNLTAFLTIPKYPSRIDTLKQFLRAESTMLIPPDTVDFYNGFKQSPPSDLRTLSERMFFVNDISEGYPRVAKENAGYMYERRNMELNIARYYTKDNGWTPFYVAKGNIWPGASAWPIIRDAPFKTILDYHIWTFVETGLLEKWDRDIVDLFKRASREFLRRKEEEERIRKEAAKDNGHVNKTTESNAVDAVYNPNLDIGDGEEQSNKVNRPLTVVHMQGPLLLFLFCLAMACIVFVFEACIGKFN